MIARVRGKLVSTKPCVVDVSGVGYELHISEKDRTSLAAVGREVFFHTYLYVREDRMTLFGFLKPEDRELFTRLIEVSGVGPRIAIGILGEHPTERIVQALRSEDHAFLCRLPGLGRKTAERLTVELKDKLEYLLPEKASEFPAAAVSIREEAILALTTLGMTRTAAEKALEQIDWKSVKDMSVPDIIKEALGHASAF